MKEVLVLGAGYAGLKTVVSLQKQAGDFHITLVDRNDYHYEATELHEVAAGSVPKEKISYPIADVIDPKKVTFIQDSVVTVNADAKTVELVQHGQLSYDYVVVALGFTSETFGIPGAMDNALQMTTIDQAVAIHEHILAKMKAYREIKDENNLRLLICGAGFTGVELAGAFADERKVYADLAGVAPEKIEIICVEAASRIFPMFDDNLAAYGTELVRKVGTNLMLGCMIKEIKDGQVLYVTNPEDTEYQSLTAGTIVWTTGVSGSPVMAESGFDQRRGRVVVGADLRDPAHQDMYIIGDVAAFMDTASNRPFPTTAQIATRMGAHVAKNLALQLKGQAPVDFKFKSLGTVASVGNTHGLGESLGVTLKAYPASAAKKMIMNKSLLDIGGLKELMAKGRFDLYH